MRARHVISSSVRRTLGLHGISQLRGSKLIALAKASKRVGRGHRARIALTATTLGARIMRLLGVLGLPHQLNVELAVTSKGPASGRARTGIEKIAVV